ncbi:MAG: aldehyde dehydrogenase family protein [Proteobacteria bacterium]|nr:aldehyde dehydrogenase family protein [Pseudomonadota bacterium]
MSMGEVLIGGKWREAASGASLPAINPSDGGGERPFGGMKKSGFGRETGFEALHGFTTLKTVAIEHG